MHTPKTVQNLQPKRFSQCKLLIADSTKLRLIKGPKSKFPRGSMPLDPPSLPHACTWICACHPKNPYNLILSPLGQKAERNPGKPSTFMMSVHSDIVEWDLHFPFEFFLNIKVISFWLTHYIHTEFHFLEVFLKLSVDTLYDQYFHFCCELALDTWAMGFPLGFETMTTPTH